MRRLAAAIDLGTNTVRLLAVEASGARWGGLPAEQRVTRLGEGQAGTGMLRPGRPDRPGLGDLPCVLDRLGFDIVAGIIHERA